LKIGLLLNAVGAPLPGPELIEVAQTAERRGVDGIWVPETIARDAFSLMAAVAVSTRRVRVASCVVNVYSRRPALLAMSYASLNELSGNRVVAGIGVGNPAYVTEAFGMEFRESLGKLREAVEILRLAWPGRRFSYAGKHFEIRNWGTGVEPSTPRLPIYLAAHNPRSLELAGEMADGVILNAITTDDIPKLRTHVEVGARRAARSSEEVSTASLLFTSVDDDIEKARKRILRIMAFYLSRPWILKRLGSSRFAEKVPLIRATFEEGGVEAVARSLPIEMVESMAITGTPDDLQRRLGEYERAGLDTAILYFVPDGEDPRTTIENQLEHI